MTVRERILRGIDAPLSHTATRVRARISLQALFEELDQLHRRVQLYEEIIRKVNDLTRFNSQ